MCIRDRIKAIRKATGLSQAKLAALLDVQVSTLQTVSYTHLDVYKRQPQHRAIHMRQMRRGLVSIGNAAIDDDL